MGHKKVYELAAAATVSAAVALMLLLQACQSWTDSVFRTIALGWLGVVMLLLSVICADMIRNQPADSHSVKSLVLQYAYITLMYLYGSRFCRTLKNVSRTCAKYQEDLLLLLVQKNVSTVFGQDNNFKAIISREDFRKNVKLYQYKDMMRYIKMLEEGQQSVMTTDQVIYLATTSGTTGENKVIPVTHYMKSNIGIGMAASFVYHAHQVAGVNLQKEVNLLYMPKWTRLPCGLVKGPAAYKINDEEAALYVQAVFGLGEREVGSLTSLMATLVYAFWKLVATQWQQICDDIERGTLNDDLNIDITIKLDLEDILVANPKRADELRSHFKQGLKGIAKRVWPNCKFARILTTGAFYHYSKALAEQELEGVPQLSLLHAASEGFLGINMNPRATDIHYLAHPIYGFLEFIPEDKCHEDQPDTLFIEQLEKGKNYEMVITSPMGLYRYRMGDVVKVENYEGQCPVYSLQYRMGQMLNLFWEKTPENVFYECLLATCEKLGASIADYTATEDIHAQEFAQQLAKKKHYILFIELIIEGGNKRVLNELECSEFDAALCSRLELYRALRSNGSIAEMKVIQVSPGTFLQLKHHIIRSTQNQQFKMPRAISNSQHIASLFNARVS